MKRMIAMMSVPVLAAGLLTGCTTTEQNAGTGAVIGGALGAAAGHNLGHGSGDRDKGALVGAAVGGLLGHQAGQQKQRAGEQDQRLNRLEEQQYARTVWIENSNGSKSSVTLRQAAGGAWIGPRGEYYDTFPTESQLKSVYGF